MKTVAERKKEKYAAKMKALAAEQSRKREVLARRKAKNAARVPKVKTVVVKDGVDFVMKNVKTGEVLKRWEGPKPVDPVAETPVTPEAK